jgi:hypothetical protein
VSLVVVALVIAGPLLAGWCGGERLLARLHARRLDRYDDELLAVANEGRP